MPHKIEFGDPEEDSLRASPNEFEELKRSAAWQDIKDHLTEVRDARMEMMAQEGASQREADFARGVIAICNDITGKEGESLVDFLQNLSEQIQERENGSAKQRGR